MIAVGVDVAVAVTVSIGVAVTVAVGIGVAVIVGVAVTVVVGVGVAVTDTVGVGVAEGVADADIDGAAGDVGDMLGAGVFGARATGPQAVKLRTPAASRLCFFHMTLRWRRGRGGSLGVRGKLRGRKARDEGRGLVRVFRSDKNQELRSGAGVTAVGGSEVPGLPRSR